MLLSDMIARVRNEIGDPLQPFMTTSIGDGMTQLYDLPKQNIDPGTLQVTVVNGASTTVLSSVTDYVLDEELGFITLNSKVPNGATIITQGYAWGMFTDNDLTTQITDSVNQHTHGRTITERMHTRQGFIGNRRTPMTLSNLPALEEPMIVTLATINTLWVLANDAATDADIQTAEGTNINRTGRYAQLMGHINDLQERYERMCAQLNVGMYRTETLKLRRVSRTTGRLVPIFVDREYDDHIWPERENPPIDKHWVDDSGIASPIWNGQGM